MTILGKKSIGPPHYPTEKSEEKQKRGSELRRLVGYVSFFTVGVIAFHLVLEKFPEKLFQIKFFNTGTNPRKKARLVLGIALGIKKDP